MRLQGSDHAAPLLAPDHGVGAAARPPSGYGSTAMERDPPPAAVTTAVRDSQQRSVDRYAARLPLDRRRAREEGLPLFPGLLLEVARGRLRGGGGAAHGVRVQIREEVAEGDIHGIVFELNNLRNCVKIKASGTPVSSSGGVRL